MAKYRLRPNDIVEELRETQNRVSKSERNPRATNTSVNSGSFDINGGSLTVSDAVSTVPVFNAYGKLADDPGPVQNQVGIFRNTSGPTGWSAAVQFLEYNGTPVPTITVNDRQGNPILADSANPYALGMSMPRVHVQFFDPTALKTVTSSSFTTLYSSFWYMCSPHLRVRTICQVDAATTGEIRVIESGEAQQALTLLPANTNAYIDLIVDRRYCLYGGTPNGNVATLNLDVRRSSGAGNVKVLFVEAISIDLSYLW